MVRRVPAHRQLGGPSSAHGPGRVRKGDPVGVRAGPDTTRLLFKIVMQTSRWVALGLSVGDLIMARRQLLNLKLLAERHRAEL